MRRWAAVALTACLVALLALVALTPPAGADLGGLRVDDPPVGWRPTNRFSLEWDEPTDDPIGYRFLNAPWDSALRWQRWGPTGIEIEIPPPPWGLVPPPGAYVVEVWLWSSGVNNPPGPSSLVALRFDAATPVAPVLTAPPGWIGAKSSIQVSINPPVPAPLSGIRGYAVAVAASPGESPCAIADRCTDADLDLVGGGQHQIAVGPALREGTTYVNVVAVSGTGVSSTVGSVPVHVDSTAPAIRFSGIPVEWVDHPVAVAALAEDPFSGTAPAGPTGPLTSLSVDGGPPNVAYGGEVSATVSGEGTHFVTAGARDVLGNAIAPGQGPTAAVRIDQTPPRAAFAANQRPQDPELIEAEVADALSGPSTELGSIEIRPAGTSQRFKPLPTQTTAAGLVARWSSDDFPHGSYEFRATAFDAAGNSERTTTRSNGDPMILRNPVKQPTALESGFGGARLVRQRCHRVDGGRRCQHEAVTDYESRPASWTVPFGRSLRFGGVLRSAAGAPLAGLPVEVVETFATGAHPAGRRTTVVTGADGRFAARLAPGPSRQVEAAFAGTRTLTRASGRTVTMAVRAGVRFRVSSETARIGGKPVDFSGRLLADEAKIPRTGRPIVLEFRVPGGEWSEFRTIQTDRRGHFRYPYAFTDDDSRGIRFQFRAVSPDQSGWPYRPAASPPVAVTGY